MDRRSVLSSILGILVAGCASDDNEATNSTSHATPTGTPFPTTDMEKYLPAADDGWKRLRTGDPGIGELGAEGGVEADYEAPDGLEIRVNVVGWEDAALARAKADDWADVGWQVVVPYRNLLFAGSTGTPKQTLTPEHPPQMPGTAVEGSEPVVRELLARSELLDQEYVTENDVSA
jgi:hypothetical protein